jgi:hypothetical protein
MRLMNRRYMHFCSCTREEIALSEEKAASGKSVVDNCCRLEGRSCLSAPRLRNSSLNLLAPRRSPSIRVQQSMPRGMPNDIATEAYATASATIQNIKKRAQAVNEFPNYLNVKIATELGLSPSDEIVWKSPTRLQLNRTNCIMSWVS